MASADQIKALIKSHVDGDNERFMVIAMQVAAAAARQGHGKFAEELKRLVDAAKAKPLEAMSTISSPVPVVQPRGELAGLLSAHYSKLTIKDLVLSASIAEKLNLVVLEHNQQHKLKSFGLEPRRKLLLVGPPGTGKTMTASALAGEMKLPLFTIVLDGLITKYMGETAAKLRLIFDAMEKTRAVYLFDEFDAIAGKRHATNDVGEIRRVLNSFLQFLEQDRSGSIIIGATNHPELLDRAVFRRFDDVVEYNQPEREQVKRIVSDKLSVLSFECSDWEPIYKSAGGLSFADLVNACNDAAKEAILADADSIESEALLKKLSERWSARVQGE